MIKKVSLALSILFFVFTGLACKFLTPVDAGQPPAGLIVYQSDQAGNFELYSVDVRGGAPTRLTNNSANDTAPAYIRASHQIGFVSDRQGGTNLYKMDIDGNNVLKVTDHTDRTIDCPDWSANGEKIAVSLTDKCTAESETCNYDIYTLTADGSILENLTQSTASDWLPVWSPDGQKIVFASDKDGDGEIYVIDSDGSNLIQLTDNEGFDGRPRWSPDGTKLVFETVRDGDDWDISIMNADGSELRAVTDNETHDFSASWSPDGNWLVYVSNGDGDNEIFVIDINGQNQKRITNNSYSDMSPIWIPETPGK